jgi:hypothetical protein
VLRAASIPISASARQVYFAIPCFISVVVELVLNAYVCF